jgi:hypothetical protein
MQAQLPIVEKLFQSWHGSLSDDYDAYRNHVYRVINLTHYFYPEMDEENAQLLQVAAAYHDAAIWLDGTFDYLEPSADHASAWLAKNPDVGASSLDLKQRRVRAMIHSHHKIRPVTGNEHSLVEAFRKADWVDVTWTYRLTALPAEQRKALLAAFPDSGFHKRLVQLIVARTRRNPASPLPMLRW